MSDRGIGVLYDMKRVLKRYLLVWLNAVKWWDDATECFIIKNIEWVSELPEKLSDFGVLDDTFIGFGCLYLEFLFGSKRDMIRNIFDVRDSTVFEFSDELGFD